MGLTVWLLIVGAVLFVKVIVERSRRRAPASTLHETPAKAARWIEERFHAVPLPAQLWSFQDRIAAILVTELVDGMTKISNSYWSSTDDHGRPYNVGQDVLTATGLAIVEIGRVGVAGGARLCDDPHDTLILLAEAIRRSGNDLKTLTPDPDGFGIATIRPIADKIEALAGGRAPSPLDGPSASVSVAEILDRQERALYAARAVLPGLHVEFAQDVVGNAIDITLRTVGMLRRLLAPEIAGVATLASAPPGERLAMAACRIAGGGMVEGERALFDTLFALFPSPDTFDADAIHSESLYNTSLLIARLPQDLGAVDRKTMDGLWASCLDALGNSLYRAFRAGEQLAAKVLCPLEIFVALASDQYDDDGEMLLRAYACLLALRDGLVFDAPEAVTRHIAKLDRETSYLEYFLVLDQIARLRDEDQVANYYRVAFTGGDGASLSIIKCLSDKNENDREIADFRGHLTGMNEVEARSVGIMPVIKLTIFNEPGGDIDFERLKAHRVAGSLLLGLGRSPLTARGRIVLRTIGDIGRVPFEALPYGDHEALGDHVAIHYSIAPVILGEGDRSSAWPRSALILGGCDFDADAPEGTAMVFADRPALFEPLPGTKAEAIAIAQRFSLAATLGATAAEVERAVVDRPQLLHFATHSFFIDRQRHLAEGLHMLGTSTVSPRRTGEIDGAIVLDGVNGHIDSVAWLNVSGVIGADQIRGWDLGNTALVTLSACESGLSVIEIEGGGQGLREAFLHAGARCVVSSLWSVGDSGVALFMDRFYAGLCEGLSVSAALQAARLQSIEDVGRDRLAFIVLGDDILWERETS